MDVVKVSSSRNQAIHETTHSFSRPTRTPLRRKSPRGNGSHQGSHLPSRDCQSPPRIPPNYRRAACAQGHRVGFLHRDPRGHECAIPEVCGSHWIRHPGRTRLEQKRFPHGSARSPAPRRLDFFRTAQRSRITGPGSGVAVVEICRRRLVETSSRPRFRSQRERKLSRCMCDLGGCQCLRQVGRQETSDRVRMGTCRPGWQRGTTLCLGK